MAKKALFAIGHSPLKSVYHVFSESENDHEMGAESVIKTQEQKRKTYPKKQLEPLGYLVQLQMKLT